jgi:peptidoglycan/xylan/chitin deacetylase (PgdA/CDA1 family)
MAPEVREAAAGQPDLVRRQVGAAHALASAPQQLPLIGPFGYALTVDVEEWYHTCLVPDLVDPARRRPQVEELDRLLPALLASLAGAGRQATFFVLGEVAARLPGRIREIAAAGHEVASHGYLHLRAGDRAPAAFRADLARSRGLLADLLGTEILGYRAPEWSLRHPSHPLLPLVAEAGFAYDSSLVPSLGSGRRSNPWQPTRLLWSDAREILEVPPLVWGGRLQLPVCGWTGRLVTPWAVLRAASATAARGGLPLMTVHPWEVGGTVTPGELHGLARFLHEAGRSGFPPRFAALLAAAPWTSIRQALGGAALPVVAETRSMDDATGSPTRPLGSL